MKRARSPKRNARLSFDDDEASESSGNELQSQAARGPRGLPRHREESRQLDKNDLPLAREARNRLDDIALGRRKVEKEYAWMDSDDENAIDGGIDHCGEDDLGTSEIEVPVPSDLSLIKTFSEFIRYTPALMKKIAELPPSSLVALCETAVRLKYFDGDLFEEVFKYILVQLKASEFDVTQTTAIAAALADLNAYNVEIFRAAAATLLPQASKMPKSQRLQWIKLLARVGHKGDDAFVEALRMAPLLPGEDASGDDDFFVCWEFVRGGFCPRGTKCKWKHPPKKDSANARD